MQVVKMEYGDENPLSADCDALITKVRTIWNILLLFLIAHWTPMQRSTFKI